MFDWWWAIDDVTVLGRTGFECLTAGDTDSDGVFDVLDNCALDASPTQFDSGSDGIGNACDADLTNDCQVNFADLAAFKASFLEVGDLAADFDGSGTVDFGDLAIIKSAFLDPPGPSGLPNVCDGS